MVIGTSGAGATAVTVRVNSARASTIASPMAINAKTAATTQAAFQRWARGFATLAPGGFALGASLTATSATSSNGLGMVNVSDVVSAVSSDSSAARRASPGDSESDRLVSAGGSC